MKKSSLFCHLPKPEVDNLHERLRQDFEVHKVGTDERLMRVEARVALLEKAILDVLPRNPSNDDFVSKRLREALNESK